MAKRESFLRYKLIIEKLRNKKQASFKEISDYLDRESDIHGYDFNISKRTFQRDLNDIRSIFNIDIKCNKSNEYFIEEDIDNEFSSRIMEAFDIFNSFTAANNLSPFVIMDSRRAMGTEHMYGLLHAIKNRLVVSFRHTKYWEDESTQRTIEPYALKESQNRWYVVAKDKKDNKIKTFGLDRISELEIKKEKFTKPANLNINEMFRNCFGIINPKDAKVEEIILSFEPQQGKYIKSYPLHTSQQVLIDNEDELRIKLNLYITDDLIYELLKHSEFLKVISPESLKTSLRNIHNCALKLNK